MKTIKELFFYIDQKSYYWVALISVFISLFFASLFFISCLLTPVKEFLLPHVFFAILGQVFIMLGFFRENYEKK